MYNTVRNRDFVVADLDVQAGTLGRPRPFDRGFVVRPGVPDWSPDGRRLAYGGGDDRDVVVIRDVATGDSRQLTGRLLFIREPRWSPDSSRLLVASRDLQGRDGIFTVDVQSGAIETIVLGPRFSARPLWSLDGSKIYYLNRGVIERTLATGEERVLRASSAGGAGGMLALSPDGRWLGLIEREGPGADRLLVIPSTEGEPRELLSAKAPEALGRPATMAWTPDSGALLVGRTTAEGRRLWEVPIDGRAVRALDIDATVFEEGSAGGLDQGFAVSPDGRRVAYLSGRTAREVWAVENLLAALPPR